MLKNPTRAELHVKGLLDELGEDYRFQKGFYTNKRHFIVDFYIRSRKKLCLEIDGGYHLNPSQVEYDAVRDDYLTRERGFRVCELQMRQQCA